MSERTPNSCFQGRPGGALVARTADAYPERRDRRSPSFATPGVRALVASGSHSPALERICDALATELLAERLVVPGAGHFVAAAPSFAERLEGFLVSVN